jgi:hypothetical protein
MDEETTSMAGAFFFTCKDNAGREIVVNIYQITHVIVTGEHVSVHLSSGENFGITDREQWKMLEEILRSFPDPTTIYRL